jgi:hypothetical protein
MTRRLPPRQLWKGRALVIMKIFLAAFSRRVSGDALPGQGHQVADVHDSVNLNRPVLARCRQPLVLSRLGRAPGHTVVPAWNCWPVV